MPSSRPSTKAPSASVTRKGSKLRSSASGSMLPGSGLYIWLLQRLRGAIERKYAAAMLSGIGREGGRIGRFCGGSFPVDMVTGKR